MTETIIFDSNGMLLRCSCGAGPFGSEDGLRRHKATCAIEQQKRRDAKLALQRLDKAVDTFKQAQTALIKKPAPKDTGEPKPQCDSGAPCGVRAMGAIALSGAGKAGSIITLEQALATLTIENGVVSFLRKPTSMGVGHVLYIPGLFVKNGLVDPGVEYKVILVKQAKKQQ